MATPALSPAQIPAGSASRTPQAVPPALGQALALPPFTLLSGETLGPSHFKGHATVLYWWASWCPFCREQTPEMQKLWQRHGEQGLRVMGISVDKQIDAARQYLAKGQYNFPCTWLGEELAGVFARPRGIPVTAVVDRSGQVVQSERGQMFPEDVAALARWVT